MTKVCTKCGVEKDISCFSPGKARCKSCRSEDSKKYYQEHLEQIAAYWKQYAIDHAEELSAYQLEYRSENAEEIAQYREDHRQYYRDYNAEYWQTVRKFEEPTEEQRVAKNLYAKTWRANGGDEWRAHQNQYQNRRRRENPQVKIATNLRVRLKKVLSKEYKTGSGVRDLGCSVAECKSHLESKFQPKMSWDNYGFGNDKWNIDHIIPMSAFDLTNRQHVVLACHYLNLQPLWQNENFSKGGTYPTFPWHDQA